MIIALISVIVVAIVVCLSISHSKDKQIDSLHTEIRRLQEELNKVKSDRATERNQTKLK